MLSSFVSNKTVSNRILLRFAAIAALSISLVACGFHLRGNIPLPEGIKNMYISAPNGSFKDLLEARLTKLGANLSSSPEGSDVILNVISAKSSRTVGTLDERGKVNSYNIRFIVKYSLQDTQGNAIRPNGTISELRRYNFDAEAVVESESEEAELIGDMEEEAVLKMVRKLASITDFSPAAN